MDRQQADSQKIPKTIGRTLIRYIPLLVCAALIAACATYQQKVDKARNLLEGRQPQAALDLLKPLAEKEDKDQLIYVLDYATALQEAGMYKESAQQFSLAEKIADVQDYHSISRVAGSLAFSEEMQQYKGDNFEKVLINVINSLNYLAMNELDEALVEVRRVNIKLNKMNYEGKSQYEQNPFAYYISAVIWEADKKWDDAYIAYKHAYELIPNYIPLHEDLIRSATKAQHTEELEKWKKAFPEVKIKPEWKDPTLGELVFIYQQGWGPRKRMRYDNHRFPMLAPVRGTMGQTARLTILDGKNNGKELTTDRIFSIEQVAIKTMEADYGRLIASRMAGLATKAVLSDQVRQRDKALGAVAWIAMNIADRADLRQWSTLPESLQIARVRLPKGKYQLRVEALSSSENKAINEVEVKSGKTSFISWRSFR